MSITKIVISYNCFLKRLNLSSKVSVLPYYGKMNMAADKLQLIGHIGWQFLFRPCDVQSSLSLCRFGIVG